MKEQHFVEIRRAPNDSRLPIDQYLQLKKALGSFFKDRHVATGLTREEIAKIMPIVLHLPESAQTFWPEVEKYFRDITIKIPQYPHDDRGMELNITLDNKGVPHVPIDYIQYKFAMAHPECADSLKEVVKGEHTCFIYDKESGQKEEREDRKIRNKAQQVYLEIIESPEKVEQMLRGLGELTLAKKNEEDLEGVLEQLVMDNPKKVLDIYNDPKFKDYDFIYQALDANALRKVGNSILYGDMSIGDTMEEAAVYLKKAENSETLLEIQSKIKAFTE